MPCLRHLRNKQIDHAAVRGVRRGIRLNAEGGGRRQRGDQVCAEGVGTRRRRDEVEEGTLGRRDEAERREIDGVLGLPHGQVHFPRKAEGEEGGVGGGGGVVGGAGNRRRGLLVLNKVVGDDGGEGAGARFVSARVAPFDFAHERHLREVVRSGAAGIEQGIEGSCVETRLKGVGGGGARAGGGGPGVAVNDEGAVVLARSFEAELEGCPRR